MRRLGLVAFLAVFVLATLVVPGYPTRVVAIGSHAQSAKKVCKTMTKKVHGKKKKVKVCHTLKAAPAPTATSTDTPAPTATSTPTLTVAPTAMPTTVVASEPPNQVSQTPAFPGVAPGAFIAGLSTRVTLPASLRHSKLRSYQTKSTQPGGLNITPITFDEEVVFKYAQDPAHLDRTVGLNDIRQLSTTIADARGFFPGQWVCLSITPSYSDKLFCSQVASVTPNPQAGIPNAAKITLKDKATPDGAGLTQLRQNTGPKSLYLICQDVGISVTPGTNITSGDIVAVKSVTSGAPDKSAQVTAVTGGIVFLADWVDLLPTVDITNPNAIATSILPGSHITDQGLGGVTTIDVSRIQVTLNFPNASPLLATSVGFMVHGLFSPPGSTVAGRPDCLVMGDASQQSPETTVKCAFAAPNPLIIVFTDASNPAYPAADLSGDGVTNVLILGDDGRLHVTLQAKVVAMPPEPVTGVIRADFQQEPCPASMPLPPPHTVAAGCTTYYELVAKQPDGTIGQPYEFESRGYSLYYVWQYDTGGISGAVKCGEFTSDSTLPSWFSWYHPSASTDPRPESNPWCPHNSPYHPGIIKVTVVGENYSCVITYRWGSRGVPDASGLPPEFSDYQDPNHPEYTGEKTKCNLLAPHGLG